MHDLVLTLILAHAQVNATGSVVEQSTALGTPYKLCQGPWDVIYTTDTVMMPTTDPPTLPIATGYTG